MNRYTTGEEIHEKRGLFSNLSLNVFLMVVMGIAFAFVGMGVIFLTTYVLRQHSLEIAESKTRLILDRNLAIHTYFSHDLKPSVFELTEPLIEEGYFEPTWMSSTYAVREIEGYFQDLNPNNFYYKEAAIDARSPKNEADAFERSFLEKLNSGQDLVVQSDVREIDGEEYFTTIRRGEVMAESCLRCHSTPGAAPAGLIDVYGDERSFNREEGEVVSAISIRIPLGETRAEIANVSWLISGFLAISLFVLFLILNEVRVRMLMSPIEKIGKKALLISENIAYLGEQIKPPVFKEFRKLTHAFNTMSIALREERDLLEERVQKRTAELEAAKEKIEKLAHRDHLTGLPNRRLFEEQFHQMMKIAHRNQKGLTFMIFDLDNFKEINDIYGHAVGDAVLKMMGKRLNEILRESDTISRWGGDEFTVLLYDISQKEKIETVVEKIFAVLHNPFKVKGVKGNNIKVFLSMGIARYPDDGEDVDILLRHADQALYQAKEQEGNSYAFFHEFSE
ncbi:MAG: diguanylate cyclase [Anaerolineales bacterium]